MRYLFIVGMALALQGCHLGDAVSEISRVDPATGKSVGQMIAEKAVKAVADPYNFTGWIDVGAAIAALIGIGIVGKKNATDHDTTQAELAKVVTTVVPSKPA
jgi:hypothetical protein